MLATPTQDIIVIGASAGGLDPVNNVVKSLPSDLAATVFIVIHTSPEGPGLLPELHSLIAETINHVTYKSGDNRIDGAVIAL